MYSRRYREVHQRNNKSGTIEQSLDDNMTLDNIVDLVYHTSMFKADWIESIKESIKRLSAYFPDPSLLSVDQFIGIAQRINCNSYSCNSFDNQSINGIGLYPRASLLNHSCRPNSVYITLKYGQMAVRAVEDISTNSQSTNSSNNQSVKQLTTNYCDLYEDRLTRQRYLKDTKSFVCACDRCSEPIDQSVDLLLDATRCACSSHQTSKQASKQKTNQSQFLNRVKDGSWIEQKDLEQFLNESKVNQSSTSHCSQSSNQAWIVYQGKINRLVDHNRKEYACLACHKKYSYNEVESMKQPISRLWEQAVYYKQMRSFKQCLDCLFDLLSLNQSTKTVTNYHPLIIQTYVLIYSLTSFMERSSVSVSIARLVVSCYETVFPSNYIETCNWYETIIQSIKQSVDQMKADNMTSAKTINQSITQLGHYEQKWKDMTSICLGATSRS